MLFSTLIYAAGFLAIGTEARYFKRSDGITISSRKPVARRSPSEIVSTSTYLPLTKVQSQGSSAIRRSSLSRLAVANGNTAGLTSLDSGAAFAAEVTVGTKNFTLTIDTGSSDTWVVGKGFRCYDLQTESRTTQSECAFGPSYTKSSTFKPISGEEFEIQYGDGEVLEGTFGTEQVTIAGLKVNTQIAVVTDAAWQGDGTASGLMGLAYPAITSAYEGDTQTSYSPIFTTLYSKGLIANNYFSLIVERNISGPSGYLAFGGVPDIAFTENFTSTPIIVTSVENYPEAYDFYTINIDSMNVNGAPVTGSGGKAVEYIVDSGTTLNYVPTSVADEIAAGYSPAAAFSQNDGVYLVECKATPPAVSININGTAFPINPLDMILDAGNDTCISGFTDGGSSDQGALFVLGDTFQKNVVTLFDVGASTLQFAGREFYASDDTS